MQSIGLKKNEQPFLKLIIDSISDNEEETNKFLASLVFTNNKKTSEPIKQTIKSDR